jgi:nitrile hydratase
MHGFGAVQREENEPAFHAPWERAVFAMLLGSTRRRVFNGDEMRRAIESMGQAEYLQTSYYEHWLAALETLLPEKGAFTTEDLDGRIRALAENPEAVFSARPQAEGDAMAVSTAAGTPPSDELRPRFGSGDAVVARNVHPAGHTRLPRYVRGKRGTVTALRGLQTFPDMNAHGLGRVKQPVYSVRFEGQELWGDSTEPRESLYIDLWESYLQPA